MSIPKKVLVIGASGLVGSAVIAQLQEQGTSFIAVSRSKPANLDHRYFVSVDLQDKQQCAQVFLNMVDITHIVYAALFEQSSLVAGWSDEQQIAINKQMFRNVLDNLQKSSEALQHIALLQGTKAYGVHVRAVPVPAREDRDELRSQPNFYWEQEDYLREQAAGSNWRWTILRPTLIIGGTSGAMSALPAIGVFAAMLKQRGEALAFPGGGPRIANACDVDLLARAIAWSGEAANARNQVFNVTNGDVYVWENVWPAIARALDMECAEPVSRSLHDYCSSESALWDSIRQQYQLVSPDLKAFVGQRLKFSQPDSMR